MEDDGIRYPRPFMVGYDTDAEEYYIFAPAGCVLVDGEAVEIADADSQGNVALNLNSASLPDCLWAHVTEDSGATGGYSVSFDGNAAKSGSKWDFRVMRFGTEENDGNQYDIATGTVNFSSNESSPTPGPTPTPGQECIRPWDVRYFEDAEVWGVYLPSLANDGEGAELNVSGTEVAPKDYGGDPLVEVDGHPGYFEVPLEEETDPTAFWLHVFTFNFYPEWAEWAEYFDFDPVAIITASDSVVAPEDESEYGTRELLTSIRICDVDDGNNVIQYIAGAIALTEGGGSSPASLPQGNFEPSWTNGELYVSGGFFPFGRDFDWFEPSVDNTEYSQSEEGEEGEESENENEGMITAETATSGYFYLEVVHDSPSQSGSVSGGGTVYAMDDSHFSKFCNLVRNVSGGSSVDLTCTRIPLYHIVDKKIVQDYRSAMSLAIRE